MSAFSKIRQTLLMGGFTVAIAGGAAAGLAAPALAQARQNGPVVVSPADVSLAASVRATLDRDDALVLTNIDVTARGGVVVLMGSVRNDSERQRAVQDARKVPGVLEVKENLSSFDYDV